MSVKAPTLPVVTPEWSVSNSATPRGNFEFSALELTETWLAAVRRCIQVVPAYSFTLTTSGSGDKMAFKVRVPPFCIATQWGVCASGKGAVCAQAAAAPASEAFYAQITIDREVTTMDQGHEWLWTPRRPTSTPAADGERRPLNTPSSTDGLWQTQDVDLWVTSTVVLHAVAFVAVPRGLGDPDLA